MKPSKRTGRAKQNDTDLKNGGKLWTPEQVRLFARCLVVVNLGANRPRRFNAWLSCAPRTRLLCTG